MKTLTILLALLFVAPAFAQTRQPASITTLPTTTPQEFDLLDKTGAWVQFGTVATGQALTLTPKFASVLGDGAWSYVGMYGMANAVLGVYGASLINGQQGITDFVRINGGASSSAVGGMDWAIQDGTGASSAVPVWGRYVQVNGFPGETGYLQGQEIEVADLSGRTVATPTPFNMTPPGVTYALALGSGGECGVGLTCKDAGGTTRTPQTVSQALRVIYNGADFGCGLCFMQNALHGTTGADTDTTFGVAALMGRNQILQWDTHDGVARAAIGSIATTAAPSGASLWAYSDGGWEIVNGVNATYQFFANTANGGSPDLVFFNANQTKRFDVGLIDGSNGELNAPSGSQIFLDVASTPVLSVSSTRVQASQPIITPGYTIATLPACVGALVGARAYITNAQTTPVYLAAVGSTTGLVTAPVFCNGTVWVYG